MAFAPARSFAQTHMPSGQAARLATYAGLVIAGSMLIALAGKITVPFFPVPATLQTLAIFTIAAAYGRNLAVATLAAFLVEGALGLPVFTNGGGLAYFAGPTTGYLAGFVLAAGLTGYAADRGLDRNPLKLFGVNLAGSAIILALGAAWIALVFGADKAIAWGVGPFIYTDVIKAALAAAIVPAGWQLASLFRR
ncbi:biotin transport system substrate-specific component [Hoeflea marina]|uniref:Biotin transporter n=1 Tax=Hoeflea marina TaxID=274592 RepID=A0A317PMD2_9HYPH|nr:biotin transporter BioY [Hoeflea marina]PWW01917.1 biotin transport system substrate-specific component [Hoeflea marina]